MENHELTLNPDDPVAVHQTYKSSRTIIDDVYEVDEENNMEIIDEEAEGYRLSRHLDMPKTLTRCLQDTETRGIKIRHKLKFRIQLHNPDNHISEVGVKSRGSWRRCVLMDYSFVLPSPFRFSYPRIYRSMTTTTW